MPFQLNYDDGIGPVDAGERYWAESPDNDPEGWGVRLLVTLLFPQ